MQSHGALQQIKKPKPICIYGCRGGSVSLPKNIKNTCGFLYFHYYRNVFLKEWKYKMKTKQTEDQIARFADMFAAMGTEARLYIMRLLLSAHPQGMIVGDIQAELRIPNSTLSHHLEKLRNEGLVKVRRHGPFLWHTANTDALQEILNFLYAECCTRNQAVKPELVKIQTQKVQF
jgi:ArsR family transcriptional regulator